jgi:transposase
MAPVITPEMCQNMAVWRYEQRKTVLEISKLARCCEKTVYTLLRYHREYGQFTNPFAQGRGRPRNLSTADLEYLHSILQANPALYLDELQEKLQFYRDVDVSIATISRALRSMALTHKKQAKTAAERNELLRAMWQAQYGDIPAEYFVWLDESSVDDRTNQRKEGWAHLGLACVRRATFIWGQRFSVLPAFSCEGIIALDIFEGSVTKERFLKFLNNDLVCTIVLITSDVVYSSIYAGSTALTLSWSS